MEQQNGELIWEFTDDNHHACVYNEGQTITVYTQWYYGEVVSFTMPKEAAEDLMQALSYAL